MINKINTLKVNTKQNKNISSGNYYQLCRYKFNLIERFVDWSCIYYTKNIIKNSIIDMIFKTNIISEKEISNVQNAAKENIKNNQKLKSNNLKLIYVNQQNFKDLEPELQNNNVVKLIREGKNAAFFSKYNKILMPEKKLQLSIFHEIGHALNYNYSKLWQNLCKFSNYSSIFMYLIFVEKIFNTSKTQKQSSSKKDALITSIPVIPSIIEEGLASIKGSFEAKKLVNRDLYRKILKNNGLSFSVYLLKYGFTFITLKMFFDLKNLIQKN